MPVGSLQRDRFAPRAAVGAHSRIPKLLVHLGVPPITLWRQISAVPGAGVDEQLVFETQEMRIAYIPIRHAERMHLLPLHSIAAAEDDDAGGGEHHVSVRTRAEAQIHLAAETAHGIEKEKEGSIGLGRNYLTRSQRQMLT